MYKYTVQSNGITLTKQPPLPLFIYYLIKTFPDGFLLGQHHHQGDQHKMRLQQETHQLVPASLCLIFLSLFLHYESINHVIVIHQVQSVIHLTHPTCPN